MIGYSGFISREWFLIAWGQTHKTHIQMHKHTDFPNERNFKKPGAPQCTPGLNKMYIWYIWLLLFSIIIMAYIGEVLEQTQTEMEMIMPAWRPLCFG